jgi:CBS domain-containing protein
MSQWRVRDVMSTEVITARDDASFAEIAAILVRRRISAVAIVDRFDAVVGVVSWTDLRDKIDIGDSDPNNAGGGRRRRWTPSLLRWPGTAVQVMKAPPITIGPDASLAAAARMMYRRKVSRLLVADQKGRLRGIVTGADLLKIHARMDAVIRDEVMQRVLRRTLMIEPGTVQATVDDGVVTLTGRTRRKTTAITAVELTAAVDGVTEVIDRLAFDIDDTVVTAAPAAQPVHGDPLHGRIEHRRGRPTAAGAIAIDNPGHPTHPKILARSGSQH